MIFYEIVASNDQPWELAATQADAKEAAKRHGFAPNGFAQVDIPTDKLGLMTHLNNLMKQATATYQEQLRDGSPLESPPAAEPQEEETPELAPEPAPKLVAPPPAGTQVTFGSVLDFILDKATSAQVEQVFASIGTRFHELRKKAREAVDELA